PDYAEYDQHHVDSYRDEARCPHHRHQHRGQDQYGLIHVHRRAHRHHQHHDRDHQQRLAAHEGLEQGDHLIGNLGDGNEPGRDQRRSDQEHDDRRDLGGADEYAEDLRERYLAIDHGGDEQRVHRRHHRRLGGREHAEAQA